MTDPVHQALKQRGLLPAEHYLDSGYPSADLLVSSRRDYGVTLVTPMLTDVSAQARAGTGFDRASFTINWQAAQVTCPRGATSASWSPALQRRGIETIVVTFSTSDCGPCPVRDQCTTSKKKRRQLTIRPALSSPNSRWPHKTELAGRVRCGRKTPHTRTLVKRADRLVWLPGAARGGRMVGTAVAPGRLSLTSPRRKGAVRRGPFP